MVTLYFSEPRTHHGSDSHVRITQTSLTFSRFRWLRNIRKGLYHRRYHISHLEFLVGFRLYDARSNTYPFFIHPLILQHETQLITPSR
jgi:hypothetical protein